MDAVVLVTTTEESGGAKPEYRPSASHCRDLHRAVGPGLAFRTREANAKLQRHAVAIPRRCRAGLADQGDGHGALSSCSAHGWQATHDDSIATSTGSTGSPLLINGTMLSSTSRPSVSHGPSFASFERPDNASNFTPSG